MSTLTTVFITIISTNPQASGYWKETSTLEAQILQHDRFQAPGLDEDICGNNRPLSGIKRMTWFDGTGGPDYDIHDDVVLDAWELASNGEAVWSPRVWFPLCGWSAQ